MMVTDPNNQRAIPKTSEPWSMLVAGIRITKPGFPNSGAFYLYPVDARLYILQCTGDNFCKKRLDICEIMC